MKTFDRDEIEGEMYQISKGPLDLSFLAALLPDPKPFADGRQFPWNDPDFSRRMLAFHLDESHDWASRRANKRRELIDELIAVTGVAPGDRALDLGCGPGLYCQELAQRGMLVDGWDYAPASIEYARHQAQVAGLEIRYTRDDYRNLDAVERFKMVTLIYGDLNVFSWSDAVALLRRVHLALLPGGFFYADVTSPAAHSASGVRRHFAYHSSGL